MVAIRAKTGEGAGMSGWENFFVGELGASAALTGLVFVGVSVNLTKILGSSYLPNRALEALVALVAVLFMCSLLLIPGQSFLATGIEVLLIGLIDWMTMLLLQRNSLRKMQAQDHRTFARIILDHRTFARIILVCQMAALSFVIAGIVLLISGTNGLYWIVAATLLSFLAAFNDAWILIIGFKR
jgi:hypothetical protein